MKRIKLFEDFAQSLEINESQTITLKSGFKLNVHDGKDDETESSSRKLKEIVFSVDNVKNFKSRDGNIINNVGGVNIEMLLSSSPMKIFRFEFMADDISARVITDNAIDKPIVFSKVSTFGEDEPKITVYARNEREAEEKAYEILGKLSVLLDHKADPAFMANLIKSFFEIKERFPEVIKKNKLFNSFLYGLQEGAGNPNFGELSYVDDFAVRDKYDRKFKEPFKKALEEAGKL